MSFAIQKSNISSAHQHNTFHRFSDKVNFYDFLLCTISMAINILLENESAAIK